MGDHFAHAIVFDLQDFPPVAAIKCRTGSLGQSLYSGTGACIVFDFFAFLLTLISYSVLNYFVGSSIYTTLPIVALLLFAAALPFGVVGLLYQRANFLIIYNTRLSLFVLWSIAWMVFSLLSQGGVLGVAVSLVWFLAALLYFWGLYVTSKAITYVNTHYRGYDDVDPERVQFIEQMLRDMIDEIKQKELDIAAGALPTGEAGVEQEVTARDVKKGRQCKEAQNQEIPPKRGGAQGDGPNEKSKIE
ncbi:hypothetical protein Y032_0008g369 [Ancylostoma ceylanicum]|uniref:Uncharacterized protein n=1 Tax=Ancylostoma ceylanicum TaxID=53326 RepID=A0A016VL76_9BILA|nr:hypothetical protein Y032_0008g369 [Ancylostoma ceylanicum]